MQQDTASVTQEGSADNNSSEEERTHPLLVTFEDELDKLGKHPTFDDSIQEYMHWHPGKTYAPIPLATEVWILSQP